MSDEDIDRKRKVNEKFEGFPDYLSPGWYNVRVKEVKLEDGSLSILYKYEGKDSQE